VAQQDCLDYCRVCRKLIGGGKKDRSRGRNLDVDEKGKARSRKGKRGDDDEVRMTKTSRGVVPRVRVGGGFPKGGSMKREGKKISVE